MTRDCWAETGMGREGSQNLGDRDTSPRHRSFRCRNATADDSEKPVNSEAEICCDENNVMYLQIAK